MWLTYTQDFSKSWTHWWKSLKYEWVVLITCIKSVQFKMKFSPSALQTYFGIYTIPANILPQHNFLCSHKHLKRKAIIIKYISNILCVETSFYIFAIFVSIMSTYVSGICLLQRGDFSETLRRHLSKMFAGHISRAAFKKG